MTLGESGPNAVASGASVAEEEFQSEQKSGSDLVEKLFVQPGARVQLNEIDPGYCGEPALCEASLPEIQSYSQKIDQLQCLMYAEKKHSLLIVLQGLDAGGKDGVARHILTSMNPAGCRVVEFKQPTREDLGHDFLWRVHPHVPAKGEVTIFNRSHYEDVLVVRVHRLAPVGVWSRRYALINDFEKFLAMENNTTVLKFFLHISKDEQLARFQRRLADPARRWKISKTDYQERKYWDQYTDAFEDMLQKTSTPYAPWYVIPANHKWFRDLMVSRIIIRTLEDMGIEFPKPVLSLVQSAEGTSRPRPRRKPGSRSKKRLTIVEKTSLPDGTRG
jgi:PPK2 family polyphosphate:nucleotide phosphotransferase